MTIEISFEKAGYCLEYLQSLRSELDEKASELGLDIQWMINRLCTFSCESDFSRLKKDRAVNENLLQLLAVYHNLLCRGVPTYPTAQIERFLVSEVAKLIPIEKSNDKRIVAFRDTLTGTRKEEWLNFLVKAYAAIDSRCNKLQGLQDSDEEKEFLESVSGKVGPAVFQLIECQRLLETMTETSDMKEVYEQRVDFSLETNGTKKVIEIDGEHHEEEEQKRLDNQRDAILRKNNWDVRRIPAKTVRQRQIDVELENLKKVFSHDPFLSVAKENFNQPLNMAEYGRAALLLVLAPIAIARIQWALNWAFKKGKLNLSQQTIKIAVVEEDIPCAFLAVWDLIKSLNHLRTLAGIESSLPRIELEIIRSNDFDSLPDEMGSVPIDPCLRVHVSKMDEINNTMQNQFDLVISISSLRTGTKLPALRFGQNNWIAINSVFSPRGANPRFDSASPISYRIQKENCTELLFFLQWIFRKKRFLDGQLEILERSLANKDVVGLLPTGGGKSLCYQLSALLQPGMTLIVDPLISLMYDQVDNLRLLQIDSMAYLSSDQSVQERNETIEKIVQRFLLMLFISPERLQIRDFREKLGEVCLHTLIPYLVIDEAHCVSEWGHDFRPSYLRLADTARQICLHREFTPSVIGLTGTASWVVLSDIQREVGINEEKAIVRPKTFDRKELEYDLVKCRSNAKDSSIRAKILELPQKFQMPMDSFFTNENAGIIFCPHVNGQYGIIEVANKVHQSMHDLIHKVVIFSGKQPKGEDLQEWKQIKSTNQKAFKENKAQLMVATNAFGMGIDKPNIRYIIHYNIPTSLEAFYQEAGRAGRDGKKALCIVIFSGELMRWRELNTAGLSVEELVKMMKIPYNQQDDIYRMLYLHGISWHGIEPELEYTMNLVNQKIMPATKRLSEGYRNKFLLPFKADSESDDENRTKEEKALYRLSILGVVSDYTLDHNAKQFEVEVIRRSDEFLKTALLNYFGRYETPEYRDFASQRLESSAGQTVVEKCLRVMLEFVYEKIEKKRRQAILNMAEAVETSSDGEHFRNQLMVYLEESRFTQLLMEIAKRIEPMEWVKVASEATDIISAIQLRGACMRALESYPDHPGVLILRAVSELMIPQSSTDMAISEFRRAIRTLAKLPEKEDTRKAVAGFLEIIDQKHLPLLDSVCYVILEGFPQRDMARLILKYAETESDGVALALKILLESALDKTRRARAHIIGGELD